MNRFISIISSVTLAAFLAVSGTAYAQMDVSVDSRADTSPIVDPNDTIIDAETDSETNAGAGSDSPNTAVSTGADGSTDTSGNLGSGSFSLSQKDASSASLDSASSELGASSVVTVDDLSAFATSMLKRDANIENVEVSSDRVELTYEQAARFLGFIPGHLDVTARVTSAGDVEIDYPWYRFLFAVDGASGDAEAQLEARVKGIMEGASGFTASIEASILEVLRTALANGASAGATASQGVTADMAGNPDDVTATGSADLSGDGSVEDGATDISGNASGEASGSAGTGN